LLCLLRFSHIIIYGYFLEAGEKRTIVLPALDQDFSLGTENLVEADGTTFSESAPHKAKASSVYISPFKNYEVV
jgi:hypothetical protein